MNFPSFETFSAGATPPEAASPSSLSGLTRAIYDCFRLPPHAMAPVPRGQVGDPASAAGDDRAAGVAVLPGHLAPARRRSPHSAARSGRARPDRPPPLRRADAGGAGLDDPGVLRPSRFLRSRAASAAGPPRPRTSRWPGEPRSLRRALRADLVGRHAHRGLSCAPGGLAAVLSARSAGGLRPANARFPGARLDLRTLRGRDGTGAP